jgi:hypothetical protein
MIRNKKHKNVIIALSLIVSVMIGSISCANSSNMISFTKASLLSYGFGDERVTLEVNGNGYFTARYGILGSASDATPTEKFYIRDTVGDRHYPKKYGKKAIIYCPSEGCWWSTKAYFDGYSFADEYVVSVKQDDGKFIEVAREKMPAISVSLQDSSSEAGEQVLRLENVSSEAVEIKSIDNGERVKTGFAGSIVIPAGETYDVKLIKPETCSDDVRENFDFLEVVYEYEVDGKTLERSGVIHVVFSKEEICQQAACDCVKEMQQQAGREAMLAYFNPHKSSKEPRAYITTLRADGSSITDLGKGWMQVAFAVPSSDVDNMPKPIFDFSINRASSKQTKKVYDPFMRNSTVTIDDCRSSLAAENEFNGPVCMGNDSCFGASEVGNTTGLPADFSVFDGYEDLSQVEMIDDSLGQSAYIVDGYKLLAMVGEFKNKDYAGNGAYSVVGRDETSIARGGDLPDLEVKLVKERSCKGSNCSEESKCPDGKKKCYKLKFTNRIGHDIKIGSVQNHMSCHTKFEKPFVIKPRKSHDVALYSLPPSEIGLCNLPMSYKIIGGDSDGSDKDVHSIVRIMSSTKSGWWVIPSVVVGEASIPIAIWMGWPYEIVFKKKSSSLPPGVTFTSYVSDNSGLEPLTPVGVTPAMAARLSTVQQASKKLGFTVHQLPDDPWPVMQRAIERAIRTSKGHARETVDALDDLLVALHPGHEKGVEALYDGSGYGVKITPYENYHLPAVSIRPITRRDENGVGIDFGRVVPIGGFLDDLLEHVRNLVAQQGRGDPPTPIRFPGYEDDDDDGPAAGLAQGLSRSGSYGGGRLSSHQTPSTQQTLPAGGGGSQDRAPVSSHSRTPGQNVSASVAEQSGLPGASAWEIRANGFLQTVAERYMNDMRNSNPAQGDVLWGGDLELGAIAAIHDLRIVVFGRDREITTTIDQGGREINLMLEGGHYTIYDPHTMEEFGVAADGNCLFTAVIVAAELGITVEALRGAVVAYIRDNELQAQIEQVLFRSIFEIALRGNTREFIRAIADIPHGALRNEALSIILGYGGLNRRMRNYIENFLRDDETRRRLVIAGLQEESMEEETTEEPMEEETPEVRDSVRSSAVRGGRSARGRGRGGSWSTRRGGSSVRGGVPRGSRSGGGVGKRTRQQVVDQRVLRSAVARERARETAATTATTAAARRANRRGVVRSLILSMISLSGGSSL